MEGVSELVQQLGQLQLVEKSAIQLAKPDPDYVLDIAVQNSGTEPLVAAACSNYTIRLMDRARLTSKVSLSGHIKTITGVSFGQADPQLLYSCSKDKTVRCWDTRTKGEVLQFEIPQTCLGGFLCIDVSHSDRLLCAGTEKLKEDSYLLFWDMRQGYMLGCYCECHDDDITQVSFQPGSDRYLATGSTDGLVCTFDLKETSEDDALLTTSNAQSAVARVGWCDDANSSVYCVTSDNKFYVWDSQQGTECCAIPDVNSLLGEESSVPYVVDCIPELTGSGDQSSATLIGGDHSGNLQLISHNSHGTHVVSRLSDGHTATVRCSHWDPKSSTLLTGGEDSLLCLWAMEPTPSPPTPKGKKRTNKMKGKAGAASNGNEPYSKERKK